MVRVRYYSVFLELCCDHDSGLCNLAPEYDFSPQRVTQDERFDRPSGMHLASTFVASCVHCDVWGSLPCTPWCTWSFVNEKKLGPAYSARLGWRRRQSLNMVRSFEEVASDALARGGGAHFEWPAFCRGWQRKGMQRMLRRLGLVRVRFDGCSFGVMASATLLALKPWVVATSSSRLGAALSARRCSRLRDHGRLSGAMATRSGHYVEEMCRCVLRHLRRPVLPWRPVRHGLRDRRLCIYSRARLLALHRPAHAAALEGRASLPQLAPRLVRGQDPAHSQEGASEADVEIMTVEIAKPPKRTVAWRVPLCDYEITHVVPNKTEEREKVQHQAPLKSCLRVLEGSHANNSGVEPPLRGLSPPFLSSGKLPPSDGVDGCVTVVGKAEPLCLPLCGLSPPSLELPAVEEVLLPPTHGNAGDASQRLERRASPWQLLGRLGRALVAEKMQQLHAALGRLGCDVRQRDLFPFGLLLDGELEALRPELGADLEDAKAYVNGIILALNLMCCVSPAAAVVGRRTLAQRRGLEAILTAADGLVARLRAVPAPVTGWEPFEAGGSRPPAALRAEAVDVPERAGTCNPLSVVSPEIGAVLNSADAVFPAPPLGLERFAGFYAGPRAEYVQLCVRQLRAGMLRLGRACRGGGTVFPIKKANDRQRVVWHGTRCSKAASSPPKPRHLANPSVFSFLELAEGRLLRVSKRDCRTWFDQLVLPDALARFMARPRVSVGELLEAGLTRREVELALCVGERPVTQSTQLHPLARSWPMGFSWSSFVAQETLLCIAECAGLTSAHILAEDVPLPKDLKVAFAVATDDAMLFSDAGPGATLAPTRRLEDALQEHGAALNPDKNIDDELNAPCVGIDLVDGRQWWPPGDRLASLFAAVLDLAQLRFASPGAVAAYLGVTQWFCLLRRPRLSVFDRVYGFCTGALATDWTKRNVPDEIIRELLVDAVLAAFGSVDMHRQHLDFVGATDASSCFGLGAAVARLPASQLRQIAGLCCKAGGHVTLRGIATDDLSARLGPRHDLKLPMSAFDVILSVRCTDDDHINLKEARGLLTYVRWVLRTPRHFGHRLVVLVDSKVVVGAVAKGRSSSVPLNRLLRRLAALCFLGDLTLHVVFIPSAHNPADAPSRGARPRRQQNFSARGLRSLSKRERGAAACRFVLKADRIGNEEAHDDAVSVLGAELVRCRRAILRGASRHDLDDSGFVSVRCLRRLLTRLVQHAGLRGRLESLLTASDAVCGRQVDYRAFVDFLVRLWRVRFDDTDSSSSDASEASSSSTPTLLF